MNNMVHKRQINGGLGIYWIAPHHEGGEQEM